MDRNPWAMEGRRRDRPTRPGWRGRRGAGRLRRVLALAATCGIALAWPNEGAGRNPWPPSMTAGFVLPITLLKGSDLSFGQLFVGPFPGTCVVTPQGARSSTGGVQLGGGSGVGPASFTVGGDLLAAYSITLPGAATMTSGGSSMTVNTFTSDPSGTGQLDALGSQALSVGATLHVGAAQAPGTYSGTFDVTVAYN